jgi:hypothetical protein
VPNSATPPPETAVIAPSFTTLPDPFPVKLRRLLLRPASLTSSVEA